MKSELKKRILTSLVLTFGTVFLIFIDPFIFKISLILIILICYFEWSKFNTNYFKKKKKKNFSKYYLLNLLGLIYLIFVTFSAFNLRGDTFDDALFITFILSICASSDIGGYVFGNFFGGRKLTKISPNKTVSGSFGSFVVSLIPIIFLNLFTNLNFIFDFNIKNIIFCLFISLFCQIGDIFISYFKRLNKVKDTGTFLPGHGGFLDRVDGIIFAIPAAYVLKSLNFII